MHQWGEVRWGEVISLKNRMHQWGEVRWGEVTSLKNRMHQWGDVRWGEVTSLKNRMHQWEPGAASWDEDAINTLWVVRHSSSGPWLVYFIPPSLGSLDPLLLCSMLIWVCTDFNNFVGSFGTPAWGQYTFQMAIPFCYRVLLYNRVNYIVRHAGSRQAIPVQR